MYEDRKESYRSPVYTKDEVNTLLNIIENYKDIVLNKSTSASASTAKDSAWNTIAKVFNKQGFKYTRSVDSIKIKWDNLKKDARKASKNILVEKHCENDLWSRVVSMLLETERNENKQTNLEVELNETNTKDTTNTSTMDFDECHDEASDSSDGDMNAGRSSRSLNFSPQESSLLLKCVREERNNIFIKETTSKANLLKTSAWRKIAQSFNKQSPQKRSAKVLRTKFTNMKRAAKSVNVKELFTSNNHEKLCDDDEEIKREPVFDYKFDTDINGHKINDSIHITADNQMDSNKNNDLNIDPLDIVFNGDSDIGTLSQFSPWCQDSKEVETLKLQLLNYQLETAKMERKRVENAMQSEDATFESNALERSLRLRAARLEAVAAEAKLPADHPALQYTYEEKRAQQYLEQYTHI